MAQMKSLKTEILEKLNLKHGEKNLRSNIKKATNDFVHSDDKRFRGDSKGQRVKRALGAAYSAARETVMPKTGDKMIYEGKNVTIRSLSESGMAVVHFGNHREVIVRASDLKPIKQELTEGIMGIAQIGPTYREPTVSGFVKLTGLDPEDIGLSLYEDEDESEDEQEERTDNGSNIRSDGHTGKKEVDELPTPSDTIAPAYSSDIPPKMLSEPLSTHVGAEESELWKAPDWDGYEYPADAPEIPTADFEAGEMGNARAPHFSSDEQKPDWSKKNPFEKKKEKDGDKEEVEESDAVRTRSQWDDDAYDGYKHKEEVNRRRDKLDRDREHRDHDDRIKNENFFIEMDDMLGHEGHEPREGDTITVTLPAMASILCTVAHKVQDDPTLLRSMIEALCEIGQGSNSGCIDIQDLGAVAAHMNGEETQEVENRDTGQPDHEGIDMQGQHGQHGDEHGQRGPSDMWPGDGEKSRSGKTKLMGGVAEGGEEFQENYFGSDDVVAEIPKLTEEEELRMIKRRAGLKFW